jgi:2'-5' RNA ligase
MRVTRSVRSTERGRGPPRVSHNLFFALRPDDGVRERIADVARQLKLEQQPAGRWIKPHRYHLTLRFLGTHAVLPDALVADAFATGDRVRLPAFEFVLDVAGSFANPSIPWWIGCRENSAGLARLWDAISAGFGDTRAEAHRVPHVTILRDADRRLRATPIASITWRVDDFVLIDSSLGAESKHAVLRRWHLPATMSDATH